MCEEALVAQQKQGKRRPSAHCATFAAKLIQSAQRITRIVKTQRCLQSAFLNAFSP